MQTDEVVCEVRYLLKPGREVQFAEYARTWGTLTEAHGGRHLDFFAPRQLGINPAMSFPGAGSKAGDAMAVSLYSFPNEASYHAYREKAAQAPAGDVANERFCEDPPFYRYERSFLRRIDGSPSTGPAPFIATAETDCGFRPPGAGLSCPPATWRRPG